jgi:hypothetical protein
MLVPGITASRSASHLSSVTASNTKGAFHGLGVRWKTDNLPDFPCQTRLGSGRSAARPLSSRGRRRRGSCAAIAHQWCFAAPGEISGFVKEGCP